MCKLVLAKSAHKTIWSYHFSISRVIMQTVVIKYGRNVQNSSALYPRHRLLVSGGDN